MPANQNRAQIYFSAVNFNGRVTSMRWGVVLGIH
jgi:hypothetical protein